MDITEKRDSLAKYYVWNQNRNLPGKKHASLAEATKEANRLLDKHPKEVFMVLYIVKYVQVTQKGKGQ